MKRLHYFLASIIACLLIGINPAQAADEVNFAEIEFGKTYNMKDEGYFYCSFTASDNGYLQVTSTSNTTLRPFKEWNGTAKETMAKEGNSCRTLQISTKEKQGYNYELKVEKGTTYYFCSSTMKGNDINVTFKFTQKTIEYFGASIEEGAKVSPTNKSSISFYFNRPVIASSAAIVYGEGKEEAVTTHSASYSCSVSADIKSALVNLANEGLLKEGDEFTLLLKDVLEDASNITDGAEPIKYGNVSVKGKLGALPAMLQSITLDGVPVTSNTKFLTYYAPGTGLMVLTFTKPLRANTATGCLRFGDIDEADNGGYYQEMNDTNENSFTITTKDNQIILDFSGKRRAVNDMVSSTESKRGTDFTVISLDISKVTDKQGVKAYTTSSSTMGRFNYVFSLDVPEANVSSDFTPANGASIKDEDYVEIWISDEQSLTYDGVKFTYEDELATVQEIIVKDFTREKDEYEEGAVILTVPIPEAMKTTNNVVVSLNKVTCVDGKDYSNTIAAKYNVVDTSINGLDTTRNNSDKVFNLNGQAVQKNIHSGAKSIIITKGKKMIAE